MVLNTHRVLAYTGFLAVVETERSTVSDVFLSGDIDCSQCPRYIIQDH